MPSPRSSLRTVCRALVIGAAWCLVAIGYGGTADAKGGAAGLENGARAQPPQRFLLRRTFVRKRIVNTAKHDRALRYLAEHYGNAGDPRTIAWNPDAASNHRVTVRFFGLPVSVHEKIAPALAAVEKYIGKNCKGRARYKPAAVGGFRDANTYRGREVSNHLFGIAIDIDPDLNPCCGCVEPWPTNPRCQSGHDAYDRAALTKCWVKGFERYGFDWLGHDELEDTMHFEFLGDPDLIRPAPKPKKTRKPRKKKT